VKHVRFRLKTLHPSDEVGIGITKRILCYLVEVKYTIHFYYIYIMKATMICMMFSGSECIRNAQLLVPPLVRAGSSVTLLCLYELDHSRLYSVKWYRGNREFFRFVPSEQPPIKVFTVPGISVDVSRYLQFLAFLT